MGTSTHWIVDEHARATYGASAREHSADLVEMCQVELFTLYSLPKHYLKPLPKEGRGNLNAVKVGEGRVGYYFWQFGQ